MYELRRASFRRRPIVTSLVNDARLLADLVNESLQQVFGDF